MERSQHNHGGATVKFTLALLSAASLVAMSAPAFATAITAGSGWISDEVDAVGTPSNNSPWTFTVSGPAVFSVTDAFIQGDVYQLFDSSMTLLATSTFFAGGGVQADGSSLGLAWADAGYSHLAFSVGPGSYSFVIEGDGAGGLPAGFGLRLDALGIPEPATWAMMLVGFGGMGLMLRRGRRDILAT